MLVNLHVLNLMLPNILLFCTVASYSAAIYLVSTSMQESTTISNILHKPDCNAPILIAMTIMFVFSLAYEWQKNDKYSIGIIVILLCGIYGVLYFDESHYFHLPFAFVAFASMIMYMWYHSCGKMDHDVFYALYLFQIAAMVWLISDYCSKQKWLIWMETALIANFALFYFILHYYLFIRPGNHEGNLCHATLLADETMHLHKSLET